MPDPRDFLLNTDYPIDNIVYLASGSVSVPNGTSDAISVGAHGLSFTPMPMLVWSNTADFSTSNSFIDTQMADNWFTTGAGQTYLVYATSTDVFIQRDNTSGSDKTLYYRVFCFAPSNVSDSATVPSTANSADPFVLNTDYNYLKLAAAGQLTVASPTYNHGLGYAPRVMKWGVLTGVYTTPIIQMFSVDNDPTGSGGASSGVYTSTSELGWMNPSTFDYIEYRLYADS